VSIESSADYGTPGHAVIVIVCNGNNKNNKKCMVDFLPLSEYVNVNSISKK